MRGIIDILILCLKMLIMWRTANADWRIGYSTWVFHVELKSNAAMWQVGLDELFKWLGAFALEWQNQRNEFWQKGIGHQLSGDGLTVAGWICVTFVAQTHTHTGSAIFKGIVWPIWKVQKQKSPSAETQQAFQRCRNSYTAEKYSGLQDEYCQWTTKLGLSRNSSI